MLNFLLGFSRRLEELRDLLLDNRAFVSRLYDIGLINKQLTQFLCLSGPVARAASLLIDGRLSGRFKVNLFVKPECV